MEKDQLFEKRMMELGKKAYYRGILTFSDFLDLNQQNILHSLSFRDTGVQVKTFGGYESAERQMAAFVPDALSYEQAYPIACIKVQPLNRKFSEELTHRDDFGASLNLSIERSKTGDILLDDSCGYIFCCESMADFLTEELVRIRHTSVQARRLSQEEPLPSPKREEISGTVASPRLDSVIALAFGSSRSSILGLIEGGKVFVNGKSVVSNGYGIKDGDIVSVRGKGKFQFGSVTNKTKKNRYHVILYRYV